MAALNVTVDDSRSEVYKEVVKSLEPMFQEAREKGLRFKCNSFLADVTMTPDEFESKLEKGLYVWGALNWDLVE